MRIHKKMLSAGIAALFVTSAIIGRFSPTQAATAMGATVAPTAVSTAAATTTPAATVAYAPGAYPVITTANAAKVKQVERIGNGVTRRIGDSRGGGGRRCCR